MASEKLRLGFIGAGWWATVNHMPILDARDDVELTAVCRPGEAELREVQERFGFSFATEDYRELLELELDGVLVCSPHHLHHEHARASLDAGCHVLCEKPMTLTAADAWDLVAAAERQERQLVVPYGWNYKPFAQAARELAPEVGEVEYVMCHMASPTKGFFGGAGANGVPSEWTPTLATPDPRTWQAREQGGGYAHGQVTHSLGLLLWLVPLRARSVSCLMRNVSAPVDLYDAAHLVFDNDAIGTISGAATLPDDEKFQIDLRIFGSDGVLLVDVERERVTLLRHDGSREDVAIEPGTGAYSCLEPPAAFVDLIRGEGENRSPGELAARTVEIIEAMHASASQGGTAVGLAS
jgi:predicted dehydrogenase